MCSQVVTDATCLPCAWGIIDGVLSLYVVTLSLFVFGVMRRAG